MNFFVVLVFLILTSFNQFNNAQETFKLSTTKKNLSRGSFEMKEKSDSKLIMIKLKLNDSTCKFFQNMTDHEVLKNNNIVRYKRDLEKESWNSDSLENEENTQKQRSNSFHQTNYNYQQATPSYSLNIRFPHSSYSQPNAQYSVWSNRYPSMNVNPKTTRQPHFKNTQIPQLRYSLQSNVYQSSVYSYNSPKIYPDLKYTQNPVIRYSTKPSYYQSSNYATRPYLSPKLDYYYNSRFTSTSSNYMTKPNYYQSSRYTYRPTSQKTKHWRYPTILTYSSTKPSYYQNSKYTASSSKPKIYTQIPSSNYLTNYNPMSNYPKKPSSSKSNLYDEVGYTQTYITYLPTQSSSYKSSYENSEYAQATLSSYYTKPVYQNLGYVKKPSKLNNEEDYTQAPFSYYSTSSSFYQGTEYYEPVHLSEYLTPSLDENVQYTESINYKPQAENTPKSTFPPIPEYTLISINQKPISDSKTNYKTTTSSYQEPEKSTYFYETEENIEVEIYEKCICVPYYQCQEGSIIIDGSGLISPRISKNFYKETPIDQVYTPPECGPYHVCCSHPETQTQKPYLNQCGVRNPSGINWRILSFSKGESEFGEWPWQVAIVKKNQGLTYVCGGTLIGPYHILTVAHCVYKFKKNVSELVIRLGEWDTYKSEELFKHEDYEPVSIIIHPDFNLNNLYNDIAIIKLYKKVEYQPNIGTICLPDEFENYDYQQCVTTGWDGQYSNILKEASIPIIPNDKCQAALRQTRLGKYFQLNENFLCAGGEKGVDACDGDGGGPLVCYRDDGTYVLMGLVSWGIDCGQEGIPGVYTRVQNYLKWINEKILEK